MKILADTSDPGSGRPRARALVKVLTLVLVMVYSRGNGQASGVINAAGDIASGAELTTLAVDIIETTTLTLDKLKTCRTEISQLQTLVQSPSAIKYLADKDRREWAKDIRIVSMNIELYSTIVKNALSRLQQIKGSLAKEDVSAISSAISSAVGSIGGGKGAQGVVTAVDKVSDDVKKATLQQTLVSILLKLDEFNKGIDHMILKTSLLSENIGNQLGYNMLTNLPSRSIYKYASRKNLDIK